MFWPEDVPIILALPTHVEMQDVVAWHYDPGGVFSVKSAYRLWCDDHQRQSTHSSGAASSGRSGDEDKVWSDIWNLEGPNRLKHFIWRFGRNSLGLCSNLERRGMKTGDRCIMCNRVGEDCHFFSKCVNMSRSSLNCVRRFGVKS